MSILEIIIQQKIILITLLFALVPLLAAVVLWLLPRLRRMRTQRQRSAAAKAVETTAAAPAPERAAETLPVKLPAPVASANPAPAPQAGTPSPAGQPQSTLQPGTAAATPETPAEQPGQPASSGLNDLLSIFDDVDNSGQREALLKGLEPVEMPELAALSRQIAAELHARQEE